MRKLTPREISSICAAVGVCSLGRAHASVLEEVIISGDSGCESCQELTSTVEYTPPQDPGGGSFTPTTIYVIPGGSNPSEAVLKQNNPDCNSPLVDKNDIQTQILGAEGDDYSVALMSLDNYGEDSLNNETGYVPAQSINTPYAYSGATFTGVDVGQYSATQLQDYAGVPASIVDKIKFFTVQPPSYIFVGGHKEYIPGGAPLGWAALNAINSITVNGEYQILTAAESNTLFQDIYTYTLNNFTAQLDNFGVTVAQLPSETQTALMDYAWNSSDGILSSTGPTAAVYNDLRDEDWANLAFALETGGGLRGAQDGNKIYDDIINYRLPSTGNPC